MLKKISILLAVLLVPVFIFSAGDTISSDHWSYKDIKSLVDSGVITKPLTKETLTRAEVVEYINDGVHNVFAANAMASSTSASDTELLAQIDKLYNLVKAYMTDMMRTEQKLDSILETIGDLKVKKEQIEKRQDRLLSAMGMRINGESSAYMTDVLLYGNAFRSIINPQPQRYRPITQYLDLKFSLNATKELYSEATFRLENVYGGFWGSMDSYGLRRFFIEGKYPVSFIFGDYQGKLTPFTLWSVDDERPYEAKIFSDKRDMNKKELYLLDNTWPLSGAKLQTIVEVFDTVDVNVTAMGARLGQAGRTYYEKYNYGTGRFGMSTLLHDQYMMAGRIDSGIPDMLNIGLNYSEIVDSKDTGTYTAPALDNTVYSGTIEGLIKFGEGMEAKAAGEYAMSNYTYNKGYKNYIPGTALKGEVEVKGFDSKINAVYSSVGNSFTAYAAQTRIYPSQFGTLDPAYASFYNPDYLTQNSCWNIAAAPPSYTLGGRTNPFTSYVPNINVSYGTGAGSAASGIASATGSLYGYPIYVNNTLPYGDSTPNRQAIKFKYSGNYMDGLIQPSLNYIMANEIYSTVPVTYTVKARNFSVIEGGVKSEFVMAIPFTAMLGYRMEDTNNSQSIAFTSTTLDAGLEATLIKKKFKVYAGYKNTAFNGYEYAVTGAIVTLPHYDAVMNAIGIGMEYNVAKPAVIGMSFTTTSMQNNLNRALNYSAQELDIKVSISF
jgi:hypothetical protein